MEEYLGIMIDSHSLCFKKSKTKLNHCEGSQAKQDQVKIFALLGNLTSAIISIPFVQTHYRSLQQVFIHELKRNDDYMYACCSLSKEVRIDLTRRVQNLEQVNGRKTCP